MNTILNKIGAMRLTPARFFGFWAILFALVFTLSSCSDDLDVQQNQAGRNRGTAIRD